MGVIQLSDELQQVSMQEVPEWRPVSPAAFLEEAVMRLVDESRAGQDDINSAVELGLADVKAGRYTTTANWEDGERLLARLMEQLIDALVNPK